MNLRRLVKSQLTILNFMVYCINYKKKKISAHHLKKKKSCSKLTNDNNPVFPIGQNQVPPYISSHSRSYFTQIYITIIKKRSLKFLFHVNFEFSFILPFNIIILLEDLKYSALVIWTTFMVHLLHF